MHQLFLSYSRDNLEVAEKLENALRQKGVDVWRDQESIYAGEMWPKTIGEAIAKCDVLLLVWSRKLAQSHFVEFEWNTALALKKIIIPILLDLTLLPPSLSSINEISYIDLEVTISKIKKKIDGLERKIDVQLQSKVIKKLSKIKSNDPKNVLETAMTIFKQQGSQNEDKKWWIKPTAIITFLILVLTLIGLLLGLPKNLSEFYDSITGYKTPAASVTPVQTQQTINGDHGTQINENKGVININPKTTDTVKVKK